MRSTLRAGAAASPFASLLSGLGRPKAAKADDEDMKSAAASEDEDEDGEHDEDEDKKTKKAKAAEPADKGDDEDDSKSKKASAEDDEDDDDDDEDRRKSKKSKKAKAAEDDNEEGGDDDYAKGAKAERARWSQVLSSSAVAGGRAPAACEMLSNSSLSAKAIIRTLSALPTAPAGASAPGLRERMAEAPRPNVGANGGAAPAPGTADAFATEMAAVVGRIRPGA